jgi:hypothetical protein
MSPESLALAERIVTESDPDKLLGLVKELLIALEAKPSASAPPIENPLVLTRS